MPAVNPYWPQYTRMQLRLIDAGRLRLSNRWNKAPFKDAILPSFRVMFQQEELNEAGKATDVFVAKNAPAAFPAAWRRDLDTNGFVVEHATQKFYVHVPHTHYLNARWLCMSVDRDCCLNTSISLIVILVLLRLAYMLADVSLS